MKRARALCAALLLGALVSTAQADTAAAPAPADSLAPAVELIYFHATLRCETCLGLEANIERCLREEFADGLASGQLRWRSLNHELGEGRALHAALGLSGSELVLRQPGLAALPIRSVWAAPNAGALCDSLAPFLQAALSAETEAKGKGRRETAVEGAVR